MVELEAVYSFKKFEHYKPFDTLFFDIARVSVASAKEHYSTVLYTDTAGANLFAENKIDFDKVVILPEIEEYLGFSYCMPKVLTMISRIDPYVHLDFDTILYSKLEYREPVVFAFPEVSIDNTTTWQTYHHIYTNYVDNYITNLEPLLSPKQKQLIDWTIFPSNCVLIVNNPKIVSRVYEYLLNTFIPQSVIEKLNPAVVEQFLFASILKNFKVNFKFIQNINTLHPEYFSNLSEFEQSMYLGTQEFIHLVFYGHAPEVAYKLIDLQAKKLNVKISPFSQKKLSY